MKSIFVILFLLGLSSLVSCSQIISPNPATSLQRVTWELEQLGAQAVNSEPKVTLQFQADNRLGGNAGCNQYGAQYELSGAQITISQIESTLMACANPEIMEQEQRFLASLNQAASYNLEGQRLILLNAAGETLARFVGR